MRLVFSYCEGAYCTQIDNKSREELFPRPSGLSVSKILLHEHLLNYGVFYVIFGVSNEPNDILGCGLFLSQERVSLLGRRGFGGCSLDCFFFRFLSRWVASCLRGLFGAISAEMSLFAASKTTPFLSHLFSFFVCKGWTRSSGAGLDPSGSGIHCVVPLSCERLFPLFL